MKSLALPVICLVASTTLATAAGFEVLAPHRAVYEVKLIEAEDRSGISNMDGRIVYEMTGSACEGVSIQYRFVTRINTGRDIFVTDQQSASYESADGSEFSFSTRSFVNEQPDQEIKGSAKRVEGTLAVTHDGKDPKKFTLSNGLFTSSHLIEVMKSAQEGEAFVSHSVFDGSADADKVLNNASVIGQEKTVSEKLEGEGDAVGPLFSQKAWPITMSYFEQTQDNSAEALPIYEASFLLYKNGVTRDLTMRYPDYALKATLSELEFFEKPACE